jgi:hypothetical protein
MRILMRAVLPLCLVAGLAGCEGDSDHGYSGAQYYGSYTNVPSYGPGYTTYYYSGDRGDRDDWWRWHRDND